MKAEAMQKLDQEGRPTGKKSGAKIIGGALAAVGILIVAASGLTEVLNAIGSIPQAFPIDTAVKWGGGSALLGAAIYAGEISGLLDRIPKFGG